jgi:hypothetical protein
MDTNIAVAVITGGFSSLVGIAALFINSKRVDDLREEVKGLRVAIDLLTGAMHELDKRLSIIEDRFLRRDQA